MHKNALLYRIGAIAGLIILILDGKTALTGMQKGIEICLNSLIPSLFPFMVLTSIMTVNINNPSGILAKKLAQFCKIPFGTESILLTGFLGGYPVGARNTALLYHQGYINREEARRLCVLANNAGPSFIFGILMPLFNDFRMALLLWLIQISSSLLLGHFLPKGSNRSITIATKAEIPLSRVLSDCTSGMAIVCSWVVLFRMILEFMNKWCLFLLPIPVRVMLTGILELSNGCLTLTSVETETLRFLLSSVILSFGGICVCLQTISVCPKEVTRGYLTGKILQSVIAASLSLIVMTALRYLIIESVLVLVPAVMLSLIFLHEKPGIFKKEVAF